MPWSHRQNVFVQMSVTVLAGAGSGFVGTLAHRMGASVNIPYGLVLAFVILGLSAWCARARLGASGLALHLIASSIVAWGLAVGGAAGDVLVPVGFASAMPFFSQHAGYIWLYGGAGDPARVAPRVVRHSAANRRIVRYAGRRLNGHGGSSRALQCCL